MDDKYDKLKKIAQKHGLEAIYVTYCVDCGRELYLPVAEKIPQHILEQKLCYSKCEECREASKRMRKREMREREKALKYVHSYDYSLWEMSVGEFLKRLFTIFRKKRSG